jgi:hypothetical protein
MDFTKIECISETCKGQNIIIDGAGGSYSFVLTLKDLPNEEWIDIPEYDGIYQCSSYGRIKSLKREYKRKTKNGFVIGYTREMIKKPTKIKVKGTNTKALYITLSVDGFKKTDTVSQWVGITFIGEKKKGFCFQHKNKNSLDNRILNIEQVKIKISRCNDFKHNKREALNYKYLPKAKLKITRDDGKIYSFSDIVKEYGRSAYFNILKGYNVRNHKWSVTPL